jgi:hypothetical protein
MATGYERLLAQIEAARPMDEAWDKFCVAKREGRPAEELEHLYDVYQLELEHFVTQVREHQADS